MRETPSRESVMEAKRLRVALINVVKDGDYQYEEEIPLGLAALGAFLRGQGYPVAFQQCFASRGKEQIQAAGQVEAEVYGFQLNMINYQAIQEVVRRIKARNPRAVTVVGGPFLASISEDIIAREPLLDYAVVGEGELTLLELLTSLESGQPAVAEIAGLVWRDDQGRPVRNPNRQLIADLDTLPMPARDFLENARRDPVDGSLTESIRIVTSRGCIGKCSFCCVNLFNKIQRGKRWRGRSAGHVVDELEILTRQYGGKLFNFSDSSFEDPGRPGKERSRAICEEIIRRGLQLSAKIYMRCETMKTERDLDLLRLYKRAGVDVIIIGAEAGSDYELDLYDKHATLADNYRTANLLRELDLFYVLVGFIMFGPNSDENTLRSNIEFLGQCGLADNLMQVANVLMLVRDSKLYYRLRDEGRVREDGGYWEPPRYTFLDPVGERMARHWQNLYVRHPATKEVNTLQVNIGNLVARMTNPMNAAILARLGDDYLELKATQEELARQLGREQRDYFLRTLDLARAEADQEVWDQGAAQFFDGVYGAYLPRYQAAYDNFLDKVSQAGFPLSGLVFKHFYSAIAVSGTKRI